MIDPDTTEIAARELREGDMVDLESIPATKDHPMAEFEMATVLSLEPTGDGDFDLSLEGVEPVVVISGNATVRIAPPQVADTRYNFCNGHIPALWRTITLRGNTWPTADRSTNA